MVIVELRFPAGRYHATPWGRHVNEGVPEWPPSPFRLARALLDQAYRRHSDWTEERVEKVIEVVASPLRYLLPRGMTSHTRSYLSENLRDRTKKALILDAFVALEQGATVLMAFDADPPAITLHDLKDLLSGLNYLGRSESWITAEVRDDANNWCYNCVPIEEAEDARGGNTQVNLSCLRSRDDFQQVMDRLFPESEKAPFTWIDAACLSTGDLLKKGWNESPVLEWKRYSFPEEQLDGTPGLRASIRAVSRPRLVRFQLSSKVLPLVTDTLPIAERVRRKVMGIHRRIKDGDAARVSCRFSGKERDGTPIRDHAHAFFLPRDEDGDGRLDHLLVYCREGFAPDEVRVLDGMRSIWQADGRPDIQTTLISLLSDEEVKARRFVSITPFITARHYRKGRGPFPDWLRGEIERECGYHGLPKPDSITWSDTTYTTGHRFRWLEFIRSRKGEIPLPGYGCEIRFLEPVSGPIALGSLCHFGLGQFISLPEE